MFLTIIKHNKERLTFVLNSCFVCTEKSVTIFCHFRFPRTTQSRSFLSKVRYIEGIRDEGTRNLVRNNGSLLYRWFVTQREFTYSLPARIQGTRLLDRSSGGGGGGGHYSEIPL